MAMRLRLLAAALLAAQALAAPAAAGGVPEPEGFRGEPYGAPVPDGLQGARTVDTAEAQRLWAEAGAAFVDVMPREERPEGLPEGTVWHDRPRDSIPGAIWLPNTGYQALPAADEAYLRAGLEAVTGGDPARPVLLFCRRDCWMSWNAAKRAVAWGYAAVLWYPEGTDGWAEAGLPTERATPWPRP